jgi:hypothetical protein
MVLRVPSIHIQLTQRGGRSMSAFMFAFTIPKIRLEADLSEKNGEG